MEPIMVVIENMRTSQRSEESPRLHVHLSFPVEAENYELRELLARNVGRTVELAVTAIQAPLRAPTAKDVRQETIQFYGVAESGGMFTAHVFAASAEDALRCTTCGAGESHVVHDIENIVLPEGEDVPTPGTRLSDQARDLIDRIEPADAAEAEQQAEGEAALGSARRRR